MKTNVTLACAILQQLLKHGMIEVEDTAEAQLDIEAALRIASTDDVPQRVLQTLLDSDSIDEVFALDRELLDCITSAIAN